MYHPAPHRVGVNGAHVTIKMMDESWIINRCVSHSPFDPRNARTWSHEDRCSRIQIPGDQFEGAMRSFRDRYGNAAVIAWDGDLLLGHFIFVPVTEARNWKMLHYERIRVSSDDEKTLYVGAVGFCSIGGQKYRAHGIGEEMAGMMIDWALHNGWEKLQVFGASSGLFPAHWMDFCIPPRTFWEKFGFEVTHEVRVERSWDEIKIAQLNDDPRSSPTEMAQKRQIIDSVTSPESSIKDWAYEFDLEKRLAV